MSETDLIRLFLGKSNFNFLKLVIKKLPPTTSNSLTKLLLIKCQCRVVPKFFNLFMSINYTNQKQHFYVYLQLNVFSK